ncbi:MAG: glycosyl hydrolase 53 family protein [Oscillospiraceae bacterium]|nr:glycosyl hydrolase 53 family protein [Oscillospiraceae bacterium]
MKVVSIFLIMSLLLGVFGCSSAKVDEWWLKKGPLEGELIVAPVEGLSKDFIRGADVSSLLAQEASGVRFYNFDGEEQDMLKTLAEAGFNYIRVRIWNDPFDANGNGYGGGNCTVDTALELGVRAKKYGMKLLVNFHYSDFWADPGKQQVPKAWAGKSLDEKADALYEYTVESLKTLIDGGADVGMVQIGNETTTGFCGENAWPRITQLMASGANAVRDVAKDKKKDIQIAVHFTNPESRDFVQAARVLDVNNVDYDIFASSYYPFWHGTLDNLAGQLRAVAEQFDKKVMVAEVAYAYSWEDFDGHANTIGEGAVFEQPYPLTVQGQARAIADVVAAVASIGEAALGVFYWEPGWIPVPVSASATTPELAWQERSVLWERHGSGWASSFAAEYDPADAGVWYGGSACDNQALFDAYGYPLPSLRVFGYCYTGSTSERRLDEVSNAYISVRLRNPIFLPETVEATYNDGATENVAVQWEADAAKLDEISNSPVGVYRINGTAQGLPVTCFVSMEEENYIENHSFELDDRSMWVLNNIGDTEQLRFQEKATDAHSGKYSLHFWDPSYVEFSVTQTVTGLRPGTYNFTVHIQGGDMVNEEIYIFASVDGDAQVFKTHATVDGWVNWQMPTIEGLYTHTGVIIVGVYVKSNGGWGTMDDFLLNPAN